MFCIHRQEYYYISFSTFKYPLHIVHPACRSSLYFKLRTRYYDKCIERPDTRNKFLSTFFLKGLYILMEPGSFISGSLQTLYLRGYNVSGLYYALYSWSNYVYMHRYEKGAKCEKQFDIRSCDYMYKTKEDKIETVLKETLWNRPIPNLIGLNWNLTAVTKNVVDFERF